jgi:hypothetical protein
MFSPIQNGSEITIEGVKCYIPPYGYGTHSETAELKPVDVIKRSNKKEEQYWEYQPLPDDFEEEVLVELKRQESDKDYIDPALEAIRSREWHRRLYGCWVWINGTPIYLTGLHYFYLNYWPLDTGLPDFRIIDLEKAYLWQVVVEDPKCIGMIEVRKRRDGKSLFAGCMLFECISRTKKALGGIQSKTDNDAASFFAKAIVNQFRELPSFFVPVWDTSSGNTPKGKLLFQHPSVKGKQATIKKGAELKSMIDFRNSKPNAYDGEKTKRLILDESGKVPTNVVDRHLILKHCCLDHRRNVIGKMLITSTVEEIGVRFKFDKLWSENDQLHRMATDQRRSGELYCFFMPADRAGDYDKYGYPHQKETLIAIKADRELEKNNPDKLIKMMRKEPLSIQEAFRISTDFCHYNSIKINDRIDELSFATNIITRVNLTWENGVQCSKVLLTPSHNGRWHICTGFKFDDESECNNVIRRGNSFEPGNVTKFIGGLDPYDHSRTEDNRRSNAACLIRKKHNPFKEGDPYNKAFIVKYKYRQDTAPLMYDDILKTCFYFGTPILFENQKNGIQKYFEERGCLSFLVHLPDYKEPGIPSTEDNKRFGVDLTEELINNDLDKVYYSDLLEEWLKFDINNTQIFDLSMAAMWCLVGDRNKVYKRDPAKLRPISDYIKKFKTA